MPRRPILTARQRVQLFALPEDDAALLRHCVLSDADMAHIHRRRRPANRLGFALQLCALRYPGRLIQPGELIPPRMAAFVGAQIGGSEDALLDYAARATTRYQHSAALQKLYGFRPFAGRVRDEVCDWLPAAAEDALNSEALATAFCARLRAAKIILPAITTIERLCADALVAAERRIEARIAGRLSPPMRAQLLRLLEEREDNVSRFVWLRHHEPGGTSAVALRLLDRLEVLTRIGLSAILLADVPSHRIARLRRQGERYYADGLRDLPEQRRLALLAVCVIEWRAAVTDAVIETHDRIVGRTWKTAERRAETILADHRASVAAILEGLAAAGSALLSAREDNASFDVAIEQGVGWPRLSRLVDDAAALTARCAADPLDFIEDGYVRFRRYTPRLLKAFALEGGPGANGLLTAINALKAMNDGRKRIDPPCSFLRRKWRGKVRPAGQTDRRLWEIAVLFALRDALRSGDVWVESSRRHRPLADTLAPALPKETARLAIPFDAQTWIAQKKATLSTAFDHVGDLARRGALPNAEIIDGALRLDKPEPTDHDEAGALTLDLYRRLPMVRITDVVLEADKAIGFTDAFSDLRTGAPCRDQIGLLSVLLADGLNLGLKTMAAATGAHSFWELIRIARWHVEGDAYARALAMIVEAQSALPLAKIWGASETASSDGQFFPGGGPGEAMNLVNARYGVTPGVKAYAHISDQFAPFAIQTIPATASEAPYILDGLVLTDAGRRVREHYADTGGFTDHVFALCAMLGYGFAPRIRDLPSRRLYAFDTKNAHVALRPMVAAKIRESLIIEHWPDLLRIAATAAAGLIPPSRLLRKLAAYSPQNGLALALREIGRFERTLFMLP